MEIQLGLELKYEELPKNIPRSRLEEFYCPITKNHRMPDWLGLEETLKFIQFHTSHYPRLLQVLSSLALDTARDPGAATAALGTLCLLTLPGNNSCPIPPPSLPSGSGEAIPSFYGTPSSCNSIEVSLTFNCPVLTWR
ncbi:hypothetical protein HGM15179_008037 [Zosterops borbonicus]|uniref:Uncharacterized protein n=1 Tax=Zosterops borbonicus TaxID=364589 RepID=A0A8K1GJZ2_9PASS|nr:hypothetical protein HGM15179_008037 [Zosterops borbonicus]